MLYKILWEMNDPQSIQGKAAEQTVPYNSNISSFLQPIGFIALSQACPVNLPSFEVTGTGYTTL